MTPAEVKELSHRRGWVWTVWPRVSASGAAGARRHVVLPHVQGAQAGEQEAGAVAHARGAGACRAPIETTVPRGGGGSKGDAGFSGSLRRRR